MAVIVMSRRSLLCAALIAALTRAGGSRAAPARDATSFVDGFVRQALQTLADKQLTARERDDRFARIIDEDFDFPRIARFTVGRYWASASEPDRRRFVQVLRQWVIHVYGSRLAGYSGETVKITGARAESETVTAVATQVVQPSGAPPVRVDWRVRRDGGDYRVVDVAVEGVSMLLTQREEFAAVIERNGGGVAGLTRTLEQKIASGDTSGGFAPPAIAPPAQKR